VKSSNLESKVTTWDELMQYNIHLLIFLEHEKQSSPKEKRKDNPKEMSI
jgi:hypothetical protein